MSGTFIQANECKTATSALATLNYRVMASFSHYNVKNAHQVPELLASHNGEPTGTFLEQLNRNLKVEITNLTETDIEFDLIGVDASIANALRRILLAEVCSIV